MMKGASEFDMPRVGVLPSGPLNSLCDVPGVTVGHCTLDAGDVQTGVTVVRPHQGDVFLHKVPAAVSVLNGFGKSAGLVQVAELGNLETPIGLTNTFGVGAVVDAQIRQAIATHPDIGRDWPTINPLVFECNDGYLSDIQAMAVDGSHYARAYEHADATFEQGSVGAGRGMSSFSFKGGIGSASRCVDTKLGERYTVGALVLSNFGRLPNLTVTGRALGRRIMAEQAALDANAQADSHSSSQLSSQSSSQENPRAEPSANAHRNAIEADQPEKGSIILLLATDAPLDARQLRRLSLRAGAGLARTGSVFGHGSGDIALAFSTAYTIPHHIHHPMPAVPMLHERCIDPLFEAAAEACEQAIVAALWHATTVVGRDGNSRQSIREAFPQWREWLAQPVS